MSADWLIQACGRRETLIRGLLCTYLAFFGVACQKQADNVEARVEMIENGIQPTWVIRGEPVQTSTWRTAWNTTTYPVSASR